MSETRRKGAGWLVVFAKAEVNDRGRYVSSTHPGAATFMNLLAAPSRFLSPVAWLVLLSRAARLDRLPDLASSLVEITRTPGVRPIFYLDRFAVRRLWTAMSVAPFLVFSITAIAIAVAATSLSGWGLIAFLTVSVVLLALYLFSVVLLFRMMAAALRERRQLLDAFGIRPIEGDEASAEETQEAPE